MDTKYLRSYISNILLESINENDDYLQKVKSVQNANDRNHRCNNHSNGFILPTGEYIDLYGTGKSHHDWLDEHYSDDLYDDTLPKNLILVSNAEQFNIENDGWEQVTNSQIHGMLDALLACKNSSDWLKNGDIENHKILFFHKGFAASMNYMTFPEFLELYGNRDHMDRLFSELMS